MAAEGRIVAAAFDRPSRLLALLVSFCWIADPPALGPTNPLRIFLSRLVAIVARRPAFFIAASVAVATTFCYLFSLLYALDPSGAPSLLPRGGGRVSATRLDGKVTADVEIRQAWIYGDRNGALGKGILAEALRVQGSLLGGMLGCELSGPSKRPIVARTGEASDWESHILFHSPLMYWNCAESVLLEDPDVTSTISRQSHTLSPFNITLTPSSVFGDPRMSFDGRKLASADAAVLSLLYPRGSKATEDNWMRGVKDLAATGRYDIHTNNNGMMDALYEICSEPAPAYASNIFMASAYGAIAVCVLLQLSKVRGLKSRTGLAISMAIEVWAPFRSPKPTSDGEITYLYLLPHFPL
jgi:hypothetical protein